MEKNSIDKDKAWNEVIGVLSNLEYPSGEEVLDDAYLAFHYYSEMESGGHEILLNWFSGDMKGTDFGLRLIAALEKIGAAGYAAIEGEYGATLLQRYIALENGEGSEEAFYEAVEQADNAYYALDGKLAELLAEYFLEIHEAATRK
ncbi:DMP19 family protein [Planococcus chinensis]|uniref:DNA mimic protein DMP19 C-terminal domain-containing protein n=1 Tax=Planococcus chinensis TaxID=272917 RepID=A0ABW4QH27_9BACL